MMFCETLVGDITHLKAEIHLNCKLNSSSYLTENKLRLHYQYQPDNGVQENNLHF